MFMVSIAILVSLTVVRQVPGMRSFAFGLLTLCVGALLGISRVFIHGLWILIACQAFMLGGMMVVAQGVRLFEGAPALPRRAAYPFGAICFGLLFYWTFASDNFPARVAVMSWALALLCFDACFHLAWRAPASERVISWPTAAAFGVAGLNYCFRAASAMSGHYGHTLFTAGPIELAVNIFSCGAYIGGSFGVLLAANARVRAESQRMALFDALTNLPNRRQLADRMHAAEGRANSMESRVGLIYLDLDGFKEVNDFMGHSAGDDLLLKISSAMSRAMRSGDFLARVGGDEFVVLIERDCTRAELRNIAERLQDAVQKEPVCEGLPWRIRVSCGMALFPDDGRTVHQVLREADAAMYVAKRGRRVSVPAMAV